MIDKMPKWWGDVFIGVLLLPAVVAFGWAVIISIKTGLWIALLPSALLSLWINKKGKV